MSAKYNPFVYIVDNTSMVFWCSGIDQVPMDKRVVLLVLFTLFLSFSCNGVGGRSLYRDEHMELKKQLKLLNKSVEETIRVRSLYIFFCIYMCGTSNAAVFIMIKLIFLNCRQNMAIHMIA